MAILTLDNRDNKRRTTTTTTAAAAAATTTTTTTMRISKPYLFVWHIYAETLKQRIFNVAYFISMSSMS